MRFTISGSVHARVGYPTLKSLYAYQRSAAPAQAGPPGQGAVRAAAAAGRARGHPARAHAPHAARAGRRPGRPRRERAHRRLQRRRPGRSRARGGRRVAQGAPPAPPPHEPRRGQRGRLPLCRGRRPRPALSGSAAANCVVPGWVAADQAAAALRRRWRRKRARAVRRRRARRWSTRGTLTPRCAACSPACPARRGPQSFCLCFSSLMEVPQGLRGCQRVLHPIALVSSISFVLYSTCSCRAT